MRPYAPSIAIALACLVSCGNAIAERAWVARVAAIPATLSGTLSPLVLALNGKPLRIGDRDASALYLDDKRIASRDQGHVQLAFFTTVEGDDLRLSLSYSDGSFSHSIPIHLPRVTGSELVARKLKLSLTGKVKQVLLDGIPIGLKGGTATQIVDRLDGWGSRLHTIELKGPDGEPDRLYSLEVRPERLDETQTPVPAASHPTLELFTDLSITRLNSTDTTTQGHASLWTRPSVGLSLAFFPLPKWKITPYLLGSVNEVRFATSGPRPISLPSLLLSSLGLGARAYLSEVLPALFVSASVRYSQQFFLGASGASSLIPVRFAIPEFGIEAGAQILKLGAFPVTALAGVSIWLAKPTSTYSIRGGREWYGAGQLSRGLGPFELVARLKLLTQSLQTSVADDNHLGLGIELGMTW